MIYSHSLDKLRILSFFPPVLSFGFQNFWQRIAFHKVMRVRYRKYSKAFNPDFCVGPLEVSSNGANIKKLQSNNGNNNKFSEPATAFVGSKRKGNKSNLTNCIHIYIIQDVYCIKTCISWYMDERNNVLSCLDFFFHQPHTVMSSGIHYFQVIILSPGSKGKSFLMNTPKGLLF